MQETGGWSGVKKLLVLRARFLVDCKGDPFDKGGEGESALVSEVGKGEKRKACRGRRRTSNIKGRGHRGEQKKTAKWGKEKNFCGWERVSRDDGKTHIFSVNMQKAMTLKSVLLASGEVRRKISKG